MERRPESDPDIFAVDTFKWLYNFVDQAIKKGLADHSLPIPETVYEELCSLNIVRPAPGNDGDYIHHGKVQLTESVVEDISSGVNLYFILRSLMIEKWRCENGSQKIGRGGG